MNEQNRLRVQRIATRHASRTSEGWSEADSDAAFLAEFGRARDEVLTPLMEDVGAELKAAGYDFRVSPGGAAASPSVDFRILIPGRGASKDTIRFFAHKDAVRGWQVIAEIEIERSAMELVRFEATEPITRDVAEQLVVDATEQLFASALAATRRAPPAEAPASTPAPPPTRVAAEAPADTLPSTAPAPVNVRAVVLERLRVGRRLHGLDLVGADLHGLDFRGGLMSALDLRDANLQGCLLVGARLTAARLVGADLTDADLTGADLTRADLTGAVLVRTRLDGASLVDALGAPCGSSEEVVGESAEHAGEAPRGESEAVPVIEHASAPAMPPLTNEPELRWARWAGAAGAGETEELDVAAFQGAALPFSKGPPAPPFLLTAGADRSEPRRPCCDTEHETMELPVMGVDASAEAASGPFPSKPLTVEQYAAFCAELEVFSGQAPHVHQRYGVLTVDARRALDKTFAERFSAEPSLQQRWRALVVHYQDWYRRHAAE